MNIKKKLSLCCRLSLLILLLTSQAYSQKIPIPWPFKTKVDTAKKDTAKKVIAPVIPPVGVKPYDKVIVKGFTTKTGLFTVHQSSSLVYFEIPDSLLNRDIMMISRLSKVPGGFGIFPGEEVDSKTIRFERGKDSTIRIRYVLVINQADSTNSIYKAVVSSSLNPVAAILPIKAFGKNSSVIDMTLQLKGISFINNINTTSGLAKSITPTSMLDYSIESIRAFPINVEIAISKNAKSAKMVGDNPLGSPVSVETNTSFIALPAVPMKRRLDDDRIGFFSVSSNVFADDQQKAEKRAFILRWRLEPKPQDMAKWKKGELVEPQKPIVIYIDPATPKQWVPYLIAGINDWQVAFEQAGFKNAIIGKEWPVNDTTMHMEDARYSFLNYFPSDNANAYGPEIHDPRSGEIIQTHIGWYHNVMDLLHKWYFTQAATSDPQARKAKFDVDLMGNLIRFVSSHEVGHTLGLAHNFGSSSKTPVDSLRSKHYLDIHGHTASIMDYARFNYVAQPEDHIPQRDLFPRIGEYDKWAVEWGYKRIGADDEVADNKIGKKLIVDRLSKNPRLWWGNGESRHFDPRCQTEDLGDDPVKASIYGIKNLKRLMPNVLAWSHEEGGTYEAAEESLTGIREQYYMYMSHVIKYIGGLTLDIKSEEESGESVKPVSVAMQRSALDFFEAELFHTPEWLMNKTVINKVSVPGVNTSQMVVAENFVGDLQSKVLNSLLDVGRLNKMLNNQDRFGEQVTYPIDQYLTRIHKGIWDDIAKGKNLKISRHERNLQKCYVGAMMAVMTSKEATNNESDLVSLVKDDMLKLRMEISRAIPITKDPTTLAHLKDLQGRIKQAFSPARTAI